MFDYQTSMERYRNLLNQSLYERSLNNHTGAIVYMMEQLKQQEIKESVLAYAFLLLQAQAGAGRVDAAALDRLCEEFLAEVGGNAEKPIDFDVPDALHKLTALGLVTREHNTYAALAPDTALDALKSKWKRLF